jgi:hypothetical protein
MSEALDLLRNNNPTQLWEKCCGFIRLDIEQFMTIQRQLFAEQVELLRKCELGQTMLHGCSPQSIEEFREKVPLTRYEEYAPFLSEKNESSLPEPPRLWQRTSGRSSELTNKWVPLTDRAYRELGDLFIALLMFSAGDQPGKVSFKEGDKFLYALAPPPYASGCWAHRLDDEGIFKFLPPVDEAEKMEFADRIQEGFKLAMSEGMDMVAAISAVLIAVGEKFSEGGSIKRLPQFITKPKLLARMTRAMIKARLAGRKMLPRDAWKIKGLVSSGTDSNVYREKIKEMWGCYPLDVYGCTESVIIAMQTWDLDTMTFVPNLNLLEFIPEKEHTAWTMDRSYKPKTFFLDEVLPGERYAVVVTNFLGGPFVRYVIGDIITITSLHNEKLGIRIPQMTFYGRADDIIDFVAFTPAFFTEKMIWQSIAATGVDIVEWVARKEVVDKNPTIHIYIEPKATETMSVETLTEGIDRALEGLNPDYTEISRFHGARPVKVTLLSKGAFERYSEIRRAQGADPAHLKPPHMNPRDSVIDILFGVGETAVTSDKSAIETTLKTGTN